MLATTSLEDFELLIVYSQRLGKKNGQSKERLPKPLQVTQYLSNIETCAWRCRPAGSPINPHCLVRNDTTLYQPANPAATRIAIPEHAIANVQTMKGRFLFTQLNLG